MKWKEHLHITGSHLRALHIYIYIYICIYMYIYIYVYMYMCVCLFLLMVCSELLCILGGIKTDHKTLCCFC